MVVVAYDNFYFVIYDFCALSDSCFSVQARLIVEPHAKAKDDKEGY